MDRKKPVGPHTLPFLLGWVSWDNQGRMTALNYPRAGPQETLSYDAMGNLNTIGGNICAAEDNYGNCTSWAANQWVWSTSYSDETRMHRGIYFLARLLTDRAPSSFSEALSFLKPKAVQDAEARGAYVRRQGEWFAIPTKLLTSQLFGDVARGVAVRRENHILGRDGHHQLEEAVIYRSGPRKGEVFARGVLSHTASEHNAFGSWISLAPDRAQRARCFLQFSG